MFLRKRPKNVNITQIVKSLIGTYAKNKPNFFFIQIGANDGKSNDPLYDLIHLYNLEGILIEPQKEVFETKLKENYKGLDDLTFINTAISNKNEMRKLYRISFSKERWASGLASFSKDKMEEVLKSEYLKKSAKREGVTIPTKMKDRYYSQAVRCITLKKLIKDHEIKHIDLMQIDTEGFDFEILKSHNFDLIKPVIINFEHLHLNKKEKQECKKFLEERGYVLIKHGIDTVAFLQKKLNIITILSQKNTTISHKMNLLKLQFLVNKYSKKYRHPNYE